MATFRNIRFWLSVLCLSLGAMAAIIIGTWSINEYSFDRFQKDGDRIVRITGQAILYKNLTKFSTDDSRITVDELFLANIPQVEDFTFFATDERDRFIVEVNDVKYTTIPAIAAKDNFFSFFSFPLKEGDPKTALDMPGKAVIDETTAKMLFPGGNVLRRIMKINGIDHVVSGVMYDIPRNSHLQTSIVFSQNLQIPATQQPTAIYHRLAKGVDATSLAQKFTSAAYEKVAYLNNLDYRINLQPLCDIHFSEDNFLHDTAIKGSKTKVGIFIAVAVTLLLFSCINFAFLFFVKTPLGERKSRIRIKHYLETARYASITTVIGLILAVMLTPLCNQHTNSNFFIDFTSPKLYLFLTVLIGVIVLLTGSMAVCRITAEGKCQRRVRKGLVLLQFTAFIALLMITLLIGNQVDFMLNQSAGFNRDNIIYAYAELQSREQFETVRHTLMKEKAVSDVTIKIGLPSAYDLEVPVATFEEEKAMIFEGLYIKPNYFDMMGMQFLEGENPIDKYEDSHVCVLNETAVRRLGVDKPIDFTFNLNGRPFVIKGVIRDAQVRSLHQAIDPQVYLSMSYWFDFPINMPVMIKINDKTKEALVNIEKQWKVALPGTPFNFRFLKDEYINMYSSERHFRILLAYTIFIVFGILIAGFYAMAISPAQQINVKDILLWIFLSVVPGSIIAWVFMEKFWLASFVASAPLCLPVFTYFGVIALFTALLLFIYKKI